MHEVMIAQQLMERVLECVRSNRLSSVQEIEVEVGVMQAVVPDALQTAFEVVAENTVLQGTVLRILEAPVQAQCRGCGETYSPTPQDFACPQCHQADLKLVGGNDILLKAVTGRQDEKGPYADHSGG
jgi:hydrogenase nickel incorporation protein HypA/HybF